VYAHLNDAGCDGNTGRDENPVPLIGGKEEDQGKEIEQ
jgi:hypothetical protein